MNDLEPFSINRLPAPNRPLLGITVLVVEDSRYACDAIRLLCLRSGARIRRADSLHAARKHLKVYRPTVILADLGLPDGSGAALLAEMVQASPHPGPRHCVLLAMSADPERAQEALEAGADEFIAKPFTRLDAFQSLILRHLPEEMRVRGMRALESSEVVPDRLAYLDDMSHVAELLGAGERAEASDMAYVAQFLAGVARSAEDEPLCNAACELARARARGLPTGPITARIAGMVQQRLSERVAI